MEMRGKEGERLASEDAEDLRGDATIAHHKLRLRLASYER